MACKSQRTRPWSPPRRNSARLSNRQHSAVRAAGQLSAAISRRLSEVLKNESPDSDPLFLGDKSAAWRIMRGSWREGSPKRAAKWWGGDRSVRRPTLDEVDGHPVWRLPVWRVVSNTPVNLAWWRQLGG